MGVVSDVADADLGVKFACHFVRVESAHNFAFII